MSPNDFGPVVDACRQLLEIFTCSHPDCDSWIYVAGNGVAVETLRCRCGTYNLNLVKK
jgi:hypothetical protein